MAKTIVKVLKEKGQTTLASKVTRVLGVESPKTGPGSLHQPFTSGADLIAYMKQHVMEGPTGQVAVEAMKGKYWVPLGNLSIGESAKMSKARRIIFTKQMIEKAQAKYPGEIKYFLILMGQGGAPTWPVLKVYYQPEEGWDGR